MTAPMLCSRFILLLKFYPTWFLSRGNSKKYTFDLSVLSVCLIEKNDENGQSIEDGSGRIGWLMTANHHGSWPYELFFIFITAQLLACLDIHVYIYLLYCRLHLKVFCVSSKSTWKETNDRHGPKKKGRSIKKVLTRLAVVVARGQTRHSAPSCDGRFWSLTCVNFARALLVHVPLVPSAHTPITLVSDVSVSSFNW